jgi:MerR family mercuric resistance operon transcriptional regulator
MAAMSISQLAKSAGVGVETVRYYQRRGLLSDPRPQKTGVGGIRHYGPDETRRLRFIRSAQAAGFTLEEIAELLRLDAGGDRPRAREMARSRIAALDEKIAELQRAREALSRLARECAAGGKGPCPIIASFEGA